MASGQTLFLFFQYLLDQWMTPGITTVVLKDKKIIYSKGVDFRDIANNLRMTPQNFSSLDLVK